jgi:hypothetical protein
MKLYLFFLSVILSLSLTGSSCNYPLLDEPDIAKFQNEVGSSALSDSLMDGKLTQGMPYYLVRDIFKNWSDGIKIPVAGIGSKQKLLESEGLGRIYNDPDIKIFMDEYKTEKGKLSIWYQFPDFYRMDISFGDSIKIFTQDTIFSSVVTNLKKSRALSIKDSFPQLADSGNFYAEVHYNDHPWRKVSYWYTISVLSDGQTLLLRDLQYEIYPVEWLELDGEPITSFKWR